MKKLVVVADDYGLCESVNIGIIESYKAGIVRELSLMLGSPATDHAVELAHREGIQSVGIHMLLKNWRDTGALVRRADYIKLFEELSEAEVAKLVAAEFVEFEHVVGRKPSHITSQFGIISHDKAISSVIEYALAHNIPMRQPIMTLYGDEPEIHEASRQLMQTAGVRTATRFFAHIMEPNYNALVDLYKQDITSANAKDSIEFALHPGKLSDELRTMTSLAVERERDLRFATDGSFAKWLKRNKVDVVPYSSIMSNSSEQIEHQWDEVYASGEKYKDEKPLEFTNEIINLVQDRLSRNAKGLYIGCGNGRNYGSLLDAGLDVVGLDISSAALDQLRSRYSQAELVHADFLNFEPSHLFNFVISIQIFQHGDSKTAQRYMQKVYDLLEPDGLFLLRVKSTNMATKHPHKVVEQCNDGAFTAHFSEGPKQNLDIHYFSKGELDSVASLGFGVVVEPHEIILNRPSGGTRAHWEAVWMKQSKA